MRAIIAITLFLLLVLPCMAEVPPAPTETELSFTLNSSAENITGGIQFGMPFDRDRLNGYFILSGQHIHAAGETHTASRLAYLEAGIPIRRLEINGFAKVLGNSDRDIDRQIDYGYFLEAHALKRRNLSFSIGLGNFARHEILELQEEAGSTFNWTAFLRVSHPSGFALQYQTTAELSFDDIEHTLTPNFSIEVSDRVNLGVSGVLMFADGETHLSSMTAVKVVF